MGSFGTRGGGFEQVEGRNPVLEALRGPRRVERIFLAEGSDDSGAVSEIISLAEVSGVPLERIPGPELSSMAQTSSPQGIVAAVSPFHYAGLSDLLDGVRGEVNPLVLALDGVEDPQNLGSLIRVAEGSGAVALVISKRRCCPVTTAVCKASAGAAEHIMVARVANLSNTISRLKKEGLWIVGAQGDEGEPYYRADLTVPLTLVLGGEGSGLGRLVKESCDFIVHLPMKGRVSSLNVATAGAALLFEVVRQRSMAGLG